MSDSPHSTEYVKYNLVPVSSLTSCGLPSPEILQESSTKIRSSLSTDNVSTSKPTTLYESLKKREIKTNVTKL